MFVGSISKCLREGIKEVPLFYLLLGDVDCSPALLVPSQSFHHHGRYMDKILIID